MTIRSIRASNFRSFKSLDEELIQIDLSSEDRATPFGNVPVTIAKSTYSCAIDVGVAGWRSGDSKRGTYPRSYMVRCWIGAHRPDLNRQRQIGI